MNNSFDKEFRLSRGCKWLPPGMALAQVLDTSLATAETTVRDYGVRVELGKLDKDTGPIH
jgi:hypothetical protein